MIEEMAFLVLLCLGMRRSHARESLVWIVRWHGQASFQLKNLKRNQVGNQVDRTALTSAIPLLR